VYFGCTGGSILKVQIYKKEEKIMPNEKIYTDELALFKSKYNMPTNYDLKRVAEVTNSLRGANAYLTGYIVPNTPKNQFMIWASKTLTAYLEANTQLNENGKYVSDFFDQEFLMDFENLAQAKYRSELQEGEEYDREMYAGANTVDMDAIFKVICDKNDKPLPTIWMEKLKKGTMDIARLGDITRNAVTEMLTPNVDKAQMQGKLTNVIAAHEAMKKLRESREGFFGWFWKLFNRQQNREEKAYLEQLNTQIDLLTNAGYEVGKVSAKLTRKTIIGNSVKVTANSKEKGVVIEPVMKQLNYKRNAVTFKGEYADKCFRAIPQSAQKVFSQTMLRFSMAEHLYNRMDVHNQKFDDGIAQGNEPKAEMERIVKSIFKTTAQVVEAFGGDLSKEVRLETTKALAKVTVDTLTAASVYPNELGGFVGEAIEQSTQQYQDHVNDYWKQVNGQVNESREKVFDEAHPFAENGADKSAQVVNQPQQAVPTINK
jgi:hypothetical protein